MKGGNKKCTERDTATLSNRFHTPGALVQTGCKQDRGAFSKLLRVVIVTISPYPRTPPHRTMYYHHDERKKEKSVACSSAFFNASRSALTISFSSFHQHEHLCFIIDACFLSFVRSFVRSLAGTTNDLYIPLTCQWGRQGVAPAPAASTKRKSEAP